MRRFVCALPALLGISIVAAQSFTEVTEATGFGVTGDNRGIAIGDFNQDGLDDIYVSRAPGTNLLFVNQGDFTFEERGSDYGVDHPGNTKCSAWLDIEGDGDLDLFLANQLQSTVLLRNDGDTFANVSGQYGISVSSNIHSLNAVDYDNDGDIDLYAANFSNQNFLWRNDGGKFTNVVSDSGINDEGLSLGAIFFDYDNDGDQDLYQTRDGSDHNLFYRNNGDGTFTDISTASMLDYVGFGMGADIADINGDGFADLYLTNLNENLLYINNGDGTFTDIAESAGVDDRGMGWSTFFFDCDNDGLQDIYLANDSHFGIPGLGQMRNRLFVNQGNLTFVSADDDQGLQAEYASFGAACADFDLDGNVDLAVANDSDSEGNQIFRNAGAGGNYIALRLTGSNSNRQAIGSRAVVYADGEMWTDYVVSGTGYASQSSLNLHFGLGGRQSIDSLVIFWPSGLRQKSGSLPLNNQYEITEGESVLATGDVVWTEPAFPTQFDDVTVYYDATQGNGALAGFTGDVFAHAGLITMGSNNGSDWQHVIGNWGTFDARVLMTREEEDLYAISYNISDFHGVPSNEEVLQLAFVFRNQDGSIVGRDADGSDIYTDVFPSEDGFFVSFISPAEDFLLEEGDSLHIQTQANDTAHFEVYNNGELVLQDTGKMLNWYLHPAITGQGVLQVRAIRDLDTVTQTSLYFVVADNLTQADPPPGTRDGLNYQTDSTILFQLFAPGKTFVYLLCPANMYRPDEQYRMTRSVDGETYWLELPKTIFESGQNAYVYLIDQGIVVADPYAELVLDPANDPFVPTAGLPDHPGGPFGLVTVFDLEKSNYDWSIQEFEKPDKTNLIIYELLMRDFLHDHSYASLIDTLDYLQKLGVNVVELMPVQEFEGNVSWGYAPHLHMATDKYYGTREELKAFIDEAHSRGIAVVQDVVFNHVFGQSPLARMYWDAQNGRPAPDNPWLNPVARHPYNVGFDVNHESPATKKWVKQVLEYWIKEFRFDGFRFDLSKGFTQRNSGDNVGFWSQYDASRIAILKDYADFVWSVDSTSYFILEHFAENSEETELANYGMMLWGSAHEEFKEAAMGFASDLEAADYTFRGWDNAHLVAYMESHDEERMMYKLLNFGDSDGDYDTRELPTALRRVAAASTIFYTIPGPKMLWQFGELGYDVSIQYCTNGGMSDQCRTEPKPIRWNYLQDAMRKELFDVTAALMHLKKTYPTFSTDDFVFRDGNFFLKTINLNHPDMDAVVMANFRVTNSDLNPKFQYPGTWYEYFTGDSIEVVNTEEKLTFQPGEYRIYTSQRIVPPGGFFTATKDLAVLPIEVFPNPMSDPATGVTLVLPGEDEVSDVILTNLHGRRMASSFENMTTSAIHLMMPDNLSPGVYFIEVISPDTRYVGKLVRQ